MRSVAEDRDQYNGQAERPRVSVSHRLVEHHEDCAGGSARGQPDDQGRHCYRGVELDPPRP